jgi:hypothetical protein
MRLQFHSALGWHRQVGVQIGSMSMKYLIQGSQMLAGLVLQFSLLCFASPSGSQIFKNLFKNCPISFKKSEKAKTNSSDRLSNSYVSKNMINFFISFL